MRAASAPGRGLILVLAIDDVLQEINVLAHGLQVLLGERIDLRSRTPKLGNVLRPTSAVEGVLGLERSKKPVRGRGGSNVERRGLSVLLPHRDSLTDTDSTPRGEPELIAARAAIVG